MNTKQKSALALMGKESCVTRQSVFVLLVSPSSLQFVSLNISGRFVCHSVRVTALIIAAASGFPQELTRWVM